MTAIAVGLPADILVLREAGRMPVGEKAWVTLPPGEVNGLLSGRLGLDVAPVARATILEYLVWPVEVSSVKIEVEGS